MAVLSLKEEATLYPSLGPEFSLVLSDAGMSAVAVTALCDKE